jgi:hypothetical protein
MRVNSGVTPILGYILLLTVIISVITMVYYGGLPIIVSKQESAMVESSEKAFSDALTLMWDVAKSNSPEIRREAHLKMGGGLIYLDNATARFRIISDGTVIYDDYLGSLICKYDKKGVLIENGGEIRFSGDKGVMIEEPRIYVSDDGSLILSIMKLSGNQTSKSGNEIRVIFGFLGYSRFTKEGAQNVVISIESNYKNIYDDFFQSIGFSGENGEYSGTFNRVEINIYEVKVEIR